MKLSDLKPCACCGGPLLGDKENRSSQWYVVTSTQAMLNPRNVNQVLGMHQYFGGRAFGLAEIFAPGADDAVIILGEKEPELLTKLHLCFKCVHDIPLGQILELVHSGEREEQTRG